MDRKTVRVKWVDPHSVDAWTELKDLDRSVSIISSFGYEIQYDDDVAIVALNLHESEDSISCTMIIPAQCILEYEYIDVEEK